MWEVRGGVPSPSLFLSCFRIVRWSVRSRDFDRPLYLVEEGYEYENSWSYTLMSCASFGSIFT